MPYHRNYISHQERVNETYLAHIELDFTINLTASNETRDFKGHGLKVEDWGKINWSYDVEEFLLVPSTLQITLADKDGELDELFFGVTEIGLATSKRAVVTVLLHTTVTKIRFRGQILEDSLQYDAATKKVQFTAAPDIGVINTKSLYKDFEGTPQNINPFGYTINTNVPLTQILEDIFGLADTSITYPDKIEIIHDWIFEGFQNTGWYDWDREIDISEIAIWSTNIAFNSSLGLSTVGDLLKQLATEFGAFAGFIGDKAFFRKIGYYNEENLQTLGRILSYKKTYPYALIDYVELVAGFSGLGKYAYAPDPDAFTDLTDRFIRKETINHFYYDYSAELYRSNITAIVVDAEPRYFHSDDSFSAGIGAVYSHNGSNYEILAVDGHPLGFDTIRTFRVQRISGTNDPTSSGTLTRVSGTGSESIDFVSWAEGSGTYNIWIATDPIIGRSDQSWGTDQTGSHWLLAKLLYETRGTIERNRVDEFRVQGVGYDFLKNFNVYGHKYSIVELTEMIGRNETEIKALYLGEVEDA